MSHQQQQQRQQATAPVVALLDLVEINAWSKQFPGHADQATPLTAPGWRHTQDDPLAMANIKHLP